MRTPADFNVLGVRLSMGCMVGIFFVAVFFIPTVIFFMGVLGYLLVHP